MFSTTFEVSVRITEQKHLRALFNADCIYLQEGGSIELRGKIALGPNVIFAGKNHIDGPATIEAGSTITDVFLGPRNVVRAYSVLSKLTAGAENLFGPFCFIRDNCTVGDNVILGAHLETTRSHFSSGVKISHRAFVGDAELGENTIIGAGVVFCNFDGKGRQRTIVGTSVTVGSGSLLVPPISIGDGATIGAGSVITKSVPAGAKVIQKR